MKLALAQLNPIVGDLAGNTEKIIKFISDAKIALADLVIFPELAVTGYPPEDLLLKPQFVSDNLLCLDRIKSTCDGIACYIGYVDRIGDDLFNAGAFIEDKKIKAVYHKINLPNYSVFDEKRYFTEGNKPIVIKFDKTKIGLLICEDIWVEKGPYRFEAKLGAKIILNINASPYHVGKIKDRKKLLSSRAKSTRAHVVYVNMVGGQDELIFDGGSMVFSPQGKLLASASQFNEELLLVELHGNNAISPLLDDVSEVYEALILGIKDYVAKNGFKEAAVGLSGGIDSALTVALACDALGPSSVHAIYMPSQYSAKQSLDDSLQLAKNFGINLAEIPINDLYDSYLLKLNPFFKDMPADITEENLQARIRGNILMAFSNKFGRLILSTGNKSETSVGYSTLYGDMVGGFNVLKDVDKTMVYKLAGYRNKEKVIIPESIILRAPTAELKPDQKDQDTLPPYEILDQIIEMYVENDKSKKQIIAKGFDPETVGKVISMIDRAEYKRRQAPPGPRITHRAFGKDWRVPITNKYKS